MRPIKKYFFLFLLSLIIFPTTVKSQSNTENSIKVFVYNEHKGDGIFNQQDYGTNGFNVCIQLTDNSKEKNCKISGEDGKIVWNNVPKGTYKIWQEYTKTQLTAGWNTYEPQEKFYIASPSEYAAKEYLFGNRLAEVHGHVVYDLNKDGIEQTDEPLLGRW